MFDLPQWTQVALTLIVLALAVWSFMREKLPPDVTSLLALLGLLLSGVLTPIEAFSGFSHPATVSVAAVLVLSAGLERTGALTFLARRVLAPVGRSEIALTVLLMGVTAVLSAFINNTAAVAVFIPVVLEVCRRTGAAPGRVLMPMSHAATFGGMCTLIGTSTNLVAHEYARSNGLRGFGMFEFSAVGLPMLAVGSLYILLVGRWFLPRGGRPVDTAHGGGRSYSAELVVLEDSAWIGREIKGEPLQRDFDASLVAVVRNARDLPIEGARYEAGDHVHVRAPLEGLLELGRQAGLELHRPAPAPRPEPFPEDDAEGEGAAEPEAGERPAQGLNELVVLPGAPIVGRTLRGFRFAERFDALVLAIHRPGETLVDRPISTPIRAGDVLVVQGDPDALRMLAAARGFLLAGAPVQSDVRPDKLWVALLTLLGVVLAVAFGLLPIVTAASAGCAVLMLTRCLTPREAYQAIDWSIVFLLAGSLALGTALQKTGIAVWLGTTIADSTGFTGPYVALAGFFLLAVVVSEFMSNSGTVALLGPIAIASASELGVNPMALMAALAFGSSAAFAMPIGYQTSLMIYGPGGYRFRDFVRMGIVLDLLLAAIALWLIPRFWPL